MERFEKLKHCCLLCITMLIQSLGLGKEDEEKKLLEHWEGLLKGSGGSRPLYSDIASGWPLKNRMENY